MTLTRIPPRMRRGFALVAVLVLVTSAAIIGAAIGFAVRRALATTSNRIDLARAEWLAEGCAETARAAIENVLLDDHASRRGWVELDSVVGASPLTSECSIELHAGGLTLDVNEDEGFGLRKALDWLEVSPQQADSLLDALLDWRDPDDTPRTQGAERDWYVQRHRPIPRNGPLAASEELMLVRGFDEVPFVAALVDVDSERVWIEEAPLAVVASLPGMGAEALHAIAARRASRAPIGDIAGLAEHLSPEGKRQLLANYAALMRVITSEPLTWTVTARAEAGVPPITATLEVRLVRAGSRAAIVRRRGW